MARWASASAIGWPCSSTPGTRQTNATAPNALALTSKDNLDNGLIDELIKEPLGGAHRDPQAAADSVGAWIVDRLRELRRFKPETLVRRRYEKFRRIGALTVDRPGSVRPR